MTKVIIIVAIVLIIGAFIGGYLIGYAKGATNVKELMKSVGNHIVDKTIGGGLR